MWKALVAVRSISIELIELKALLGMDQWVKLSLMGDLMIYFTVRSHGLGATAIWPLES